MPASQTRFTPIKTQDFLDFGKTLDAIEQLNDVYQTAPILINQLLECDAVFLYLLTNENVYQKKYCSNTNYQHLLKNEYPKGEKWLGDEKYHKNYVLEVKHIKHFKEHEKIKEILLSPLNNSNRTFGFLIALNSQKSLNQLQTQDTDSLDYFSQVLSFVIANKKKNSQLDMVLNVFSGLSINAEEKEIFQHLVNRLTGKFSKYNACIIHLYDEIKDSLFGYVSAGITVKKEGSSRVPKGKFKIWQAFESGKIQVSRIDNDTNFAIRNWVSDNGFKSMITFQLKDINNTPYGVLSLFTKYIYKQEREDELFLDRFINQTSKIITGIRNEQKIKKLEEVESLLSEIIPLDKPLSEILNTFLERSLKSLNGEIGFISLFSKKTEEIVANSFIKLDNKAFKVVKMPDKLFLNKGNSLARHVYETQKPYIFSTDLNIDEKTRTYEGLTTDIESEILVPLIYQNEFIGIMVLSSTQKHAFNEKDKNFLSTIAQKAAQVIQNKRFHDASLKLNEFKYELLEIEAICNKTAQITTNLLETSFCEVWLKQEDTLVLSGWADTSNLHDMENLIMSRNDVSLSWKVLEEVESKNYTQIIRQFKNIQNNPETHNQGWAKLNGMKSMICVPIIHNHKILGIINTHTKRNYNFFEHEGILIKNIAIRCASNLFNSKLNTTYEELLDRWTSINTIANPGMVALTFVHDISHYIHFLNSDIDLLDSFISGSKLANNKNEIEIIDNLLDSISKNTSLIKKSFGSLIRIGKRIKSRKKKSSIKEIIKNVEYLFQRRFEQNKINFNSTIEGGDLELKCYPNELEQMFVNLTLNAITAIRKKPKSKRKISIKIYKSKIIKEIKIEFKDNGVGIHPNNWREIFKIGYSTKGEKGTGFGLSICKRIVENHNGKIKVMSKLEKETTFLISLPLI